MKLKAFISSLLVISHILVMVWYYSHDPKWAIIHKDLASLFFFGFSFLLIGLNMFITSSERILPIQNELSKFHSVFIMLLGTIYALHYSGVLITTNRQKLIMICVGVLTIFVIIMLSAWRHGFFNKKTYNG